MSSKVNDPRNTSTVYYPMKTWKKVSNWRKTHASDSNPLSRLNYKQNYVKKPAPQ